MKRPGIIIAIDGYSSTGKSSFAKKVASTYGFLYLDSGALYRAITLYAMENGMVVDAQPDFERLLPLPQSLNLHFEYVDGACHTFIGKRDVEKEIRTLGVSNLVSPVSAHAQVRKYVDEILHKLGRERGVIMDGRDIGSTVFPDAELKIFMTADPLVRAQRRQEEMKEKGEQCSLEEVMENIKQRDYIDSHRDASPLTQAPDAIVLDNTNLSFSEELDWIGKILQERFSIKPVTE